MKEAKTPSKPSPRGLWTALWESQMWQTGMMTMSKLTQHPRGKLQEFPFLPYQVLNFPVFSKFQSCHGQLLPKCESSERIFYLHPGFRAPLTPISGP